MFFDIPKIPVIFLPNAEAAGEEILLLPIYECGSCHANATAPQSVSVDNKWILHISAPSNVRSRDSYAGFGGRSWDGLKSLTLGSVLFSFKKPTTSAVISSNVVGSG